MQKTQQKTDVVIVGAGPVGLFAVFQCGMLKMKCHVIDSLADIGGQCTALYPEKPIYDIPAQPAITAGGLIEQLAAQAAPFNPVYHLNQRADILQQTAEGFTVTTSAGTVIQAKAVMIAAGAGAFGPNRPPIDNLAQFENHSVFYMVRRRDDFAGRKIAIAGGGDSAVDWAISLSTVAEKIYFIHRRDKFRAAPDSIEKLNAIAATGKIDMVIPAQLHALTAHDDRPQMIKSLTVADLAGATRDIDIDILLPFFGLTPQLGPIADWGLDAAHFHVPVDQSTSQTCVKGIYAIGDIATYDNKLKLILTGFAEAAQAAHHAYGLVFPDQALHFVYSTTKGIT